MITLQDFLSAKKFAIRNLGVMDFWFNYNNKWCALDSAYPNKLTVDDYNEKGFIVSTFCLNVPVVTTISFENCFLETEVEL